MVESIRIQNLKSIKDSGVIEIKPLTVLIGKNSSGKSTFLRTFPLLKQSFEANLSDPILWFHEYYVDFGSFRNSLNEECNEAEDTIDLSFVFSSPSFRLYRSKKIKRIAVKMSIGEHSIKKYEVLVDDLNRFVFELENRGKDYKLSVNDEVIKGAKFVLPENGRTKMPVYKERPNTYYYRGTPIIDETIAKKYAESEAEARRMTFDSVSLMLNEPITIQSSQKDARDYFKDVLKLEKHIDEEDIDIVATNLISNTALELLEIVEDCMSNTFTRVQYFQPIRARGDRFYRVQGLNTKEVDSDGNNGAMFLFNLSETKRNSFEKWCMSNFGFTYSISKKTDGVESTSVVIKTNSKDPQERNMTDVGFGYSQIFPIILSLWNHIDSGKTFYEKVYVIEQPELHLHPAFQKKIMKAIFNIIKISEEVKAPTKFIIETHSETIINAIGKEVSERGNSSDINLLVCNKIDNHTTFEKMVFDKNGLIENWPIGFFTDDE